MSHQFCLSNERLFSSDVLLSTIFAPFSGFCTICPAHITFHVSDSTVCKVMLEPIYNYKAGRKTQFSLHAPSCKRSIYAREIKDSCTCDDQHVHICQLQIHPCTSEAKSYYKPTSAAGTHLLLHAGAQHLHLGKDANVHFGAGAMHRQPLQPLHGQLHAVLLHSRVKHTRGLCLCLYNTAHMTNCFPPNRAA